MIDAKQVKRCDAEIAHGGICFKRASWQIHTASAVLHYCEKHKRQREKNEGAYFRRMPFAEWEPIAYNFNKGE